LILQFEDVIGLTVKSVGPELSPGRRVDQLRTDTKLLADGPQTALDEVADPKRTPDLAAVNRATLISKGRLPGDHDEAGNSRQHRNQILSHRLR
jgi:hypothetical protein